MKNEKRIVETLLAVVGDDSRDRDFYTGHQARPFKLTYRVTSMP